jgi:hypothetical protein
MGFVVIIRIISGNFNSNKRINMNKAEIRACDYKICPSYKVENPTLIQHAFMLLAFLIMTYMVYTIVSK